MSYFGGSVGRGDPGFFGSLGGFLKRTVGGFVRGGPVGAAASAFTPPRQGGVVPTISKAFLGTRPRGALPGPGPFGAQLPRKRRRMNVANDKALRRAIRRQAGFVKLAKRALTGTGFKIVSTSSGKVSRSAMDKAVAAAHHAK